MRLAALGCLTLLTVAGCSRQQAEGPASPVVVAPTVASTAATAASAVAATSATSQAPASVDDSHRIRLRRKMPPPADGFPPAANLDFTPGASPSAAHPQGTVFVVLFDDDEAYRVTEWDLATRLGLHQTVLDPHGADLQILSRGTSVRIMASMYNGDLNLLQLTDSLQLIANQRLGHVSVSGPNALAGDDHLTVVLADGIPDDTGAATDPAGLFAMSFDPAGRRIAKRILLHERGDSVMMGGNLAVIDGHVYVALVDSSDRLRVLQLSRDLRTEREKPIALAPTFDNVRAKLLDVDGHLVLDAQGQPDWLELSPDLSKMTHRPRPAPVPDFPGKGCGAAIRTPSQLFALCDCGKDTCLAWAPLLPVPERQ